MIAFLNVLGAMLCLDKAPPKAVLTGGHVHIGCELLADLLFDMGGHTWEHIHLHPLLLLDLDCTTLQSLPQLCLSSHHNLEGAILSFLLTPSPPQKKNFLPCPKYGASNFHSNGKRFRIRQDCFPCVVNIFLGISPDKPLPLLL